MTALKNKIWAWIQAEIASRPKEMWRAQLIAWRKELMHHARFMFAWVGLIWMVWMLDYWLPEDYSFPRLGIQPRTWRGLLGIPVAPFIHLRTDTEAANPWLTVPWHLVGNTIPFFILGVLVSMGGKRVFYISSAAIILGAGLGCWFFGAEGDHYGASGVVLGWFAFLVCRGLFELRLRWFLVSVGVFVAYYDMLMGLLPSTGVSWSSHFFGFLSGILVAMWMFLVPRRKIERELRTRGLL